MTKEDQSLLRTKDNYVADVKKVFDSTGVKERCIFNDLPNFHIAENKSVDVMHDLFEGVANYTILKILTHFIEKKKYFTLETLNDRIDHFPYNDADKGSKPRPVIKQNSKKVKNDKIQTKIKLKQSAAEMLCLTRYLGIIIGDLILDKNDSHWKLYLTLRDIVGIVTAPRYLISKISEVTQLIERHNTLYLELFGLLKPKMDFLVHLPQIMLDNGPVVHFWSTFGACHSSVRIRH